LRSQKLIIKTVMEQNPRAKKKKLKGIYIREISLNELTKERRLDIKKR